MLIAPAASYIVLDGSLRAESHLSPFRIYKVQSDGDLHFIKAAQRFNDATAVVRKLGEMWPGEYVIDKEQTREWVSITADSQTENWTSTL